MNIYQSKACHFGAVGVGICALLLSSTASSAVIFSNNHQYAFGADLNAVEIFVEVFDNFAGDTGKYEWRYTVTNNSFDPNPGSSNGFSGFETALPAGVPDLQDLYAPNPSWVFDCCSGQPVEWDIRNSAGLGVMPGETGVFGFSSLPRLRTESTGWFHTWESEAQTTIVNYDLGNGVEVPNVLLPPIIVPEPTTLACLTVSLLAMGVARRRRSGHL